MAGVNYPKRKRVVTTRPSSDYCRTCRARRVKCDGQRPECKRCISAGRKCGGFTTWEIALVGDNRKPFSVVRKTASKNALAVVRPSPINTPKAVDADDGDDDHHAEETRGDSPNFNFVARPVSAFTTFRIGDGGQHAFEYFRHKGQQMLVDVSPNPVATTRWTQLALCLSSQESSLLYAIAAVSSKQLALTPALDVTLSRPETSANSGVANLHFSKALGLLQERIQHAHTPGTVESIAIICLLCLMFEVYRGRTLHAIKHFAVAKNVIRNYLEKNQTHSPGIDMINFLSRIFNFTSNDSVRPPQRSTEKITEVKIPATPKYAFQFHSLDQAGAHLETLIDASRRTQSQLLGVAEHALVGTSAGAHALDSARYFCLSRCLSRAVWMHDRSELRKLHADTVSHFLTWERAFTELVDLEKSTDRPAFMHYIRFFTNFISLATCRQAQVKQLNQFTARFNRTLRLIERYLKLCQPKSNTKPQPLAPENQHFNAAMLEHGAIHALFTICCRCRATETRRKAAQLLFDTNRTEAPFDSRDIAVFAASIIDIEEARARQLLSYSSPDVSLSKGISGDQLPEAATFLDFVISGEFGRGKLFRIITARFAFERHGELELLDYRSSWDSEHLAYTDTKPVVPQPALSASLGDAVASLGPVSVFEALEFERLGEWSTEHINH